MNIAKRADRLYEKLDSLANGQTYAIEQAMLRVRKDTLDEVIKEVTSLVNEFKYRYEQGKKDIWCNEYQDGCNESSYNTADGILETILALKKKE